MNPGPGFSWQAVSNQLPASDAEEMTSRTEQLHPIGPTIARDGLRLHFLDHGRPGRAGVLLLHGSGAHAHWWDEFVPHLGDAFHVVALDLRGHGDSDWAEPPRYEYLDYAGDALAVLDHLGWDRAVVVGHSMGGHVAVLAAAEWPERVRALVVIDSMPRLPSEVLSAFRSIGHRPARRHPDLETYVAHYRVRPDGTSAPAEVVRRLAIHAARREPDGWYVHKCDRRTYAERRGVDMVGYWARVRCPALLLGGARSDRLTPERVSLVRGACPQARFATIPNAGHHVFLDQPAACGKAVREFLAGGDSTG